MATERKLCGAETPDGPCTRWPHTEGEHGEVEYREIKHHPWAKVALNVERIVAEGGIILQSWTCDKCGAVQRIGEANGFYIEGECENCGHVTNLKVKGCNFTLLLTNARPELRNMLKAMGFVPPRDN